MYKLRSLTLSAALLLSTAAQAEVAPTDAITAPGTAEPRHVILIIGDGMDEHQVTIARNYLKGAQGQLQLDQMPMRGASQILTIEDKVGGKPVYVADSANTASSMATGEITSRGRISTSAGDDRDLPTIAELASAAGYRTGIVSTASVTDATPSAFAAHISFRLCENPELVEEVVYRDIPLGSCAQDLKRNGGQGSISEQLAASSIDVILGGGSMHFTVQAEDSGNTVLELAQQNGFKVVTTPAELQAGADGKRLLGLFSDSTMPVRLQGEDGRIAEQPEPSWLNYIHRYLGDVTMPETMSCEPNPDFNGMPTLKQMTDAAIAHLSEDNNEGFFLTIESASIDKQAHERKPCGSIGELEQLDEALASALAFAQDNPRTLILVTADHSQAAQLIPYHSLFAAYPIPTFTPGYVALIETPEGSHMAVNYATTNFMMEEHTGAAVPLYSNSEGQGLVPPFVQQPQLFGIMKEYLEL
jgi:alkaline phosphatase